MPTELIIYTDESDKDGKFFSNFYGGALVRSSDLEPVVRRIDSTMDKLFLKNEIKWQRVTENYLGKYIAVMDALFDEVDANRVKLRIMFTSNQYIPLGLTSEQRQTAYHRLYYQFIKHAFGLSFCSRDLRPPVNVRVNLDQMPTNSEETAQFKAFVEGLNRNPDLARARVRFNSEQIAEVDSRDHVLLQCLDVVLGAMTFRLNNKHLEKPPGQSRKANHRQREALPAHLASDSGHLSELQHR
jgi:hypothetical protein